MRLRLIHRPGRPAGLAALIAGLATLVPLTGAAPASAARTAAAAIAAASPALPAPVHRGTLRITGESRDGAVVTASGLAWHAPRLPHGDRLLSFEVAYTWQSCAPSGRHCRAAAATTAAPFAARRYRAGHADTGRRLRVTETAAEVVQTKARDFTFRVLRRSVTPGWPGPQSARTGGISARLLISATEPRNGVPPRRRSISRSARRTTTPGTASPSSGTGWTGTGGDRCRAITFSTPGSWRPARTR